MADRRLSVVIPTWNRAAHVGPCLAPLLEPAAAGLEVIVVDDGSVDDTAGAVKAAAAASRGADIRYERQANAGPGAARNRGVALARSEWILFHDIDDRLLPWAIPILRDALDEAGGCAMLFLAAQTFVEDAELAAAGRGPVRLERDADFAAFAARRPLEIYGSCNVAVRRALLEEVGGFEPSIRCAEDIDLFYRLAGRGPVLTVTAPVMMGYRVNSAGSLSADPAHMRRGQDFLTEGLRTGRYAVPDEVLAGELARKRQVLARVWMAEGRLADAWGLLLPEAALMLRSMGAAAFLKLCLTPLLSLVRPAHYRFGWRKALARAR